MRAISGRRFGRGVLFVSIFAGYAADGFGQEYIREFYPYQRDAEAYAPMLQTDTALFYRAVQTATDLYGANTDYNLPMVAVGRRGRTYADESTLLNGMPIENYRTCALLRILGASEETYPGATAPEGHSGAGEGIRILRFDEAIQLRPYYAALSLTDRNYRLGLRDRKSVV